MSDYSFLKGLVLVDTGRLRQPNKKNPEGLTVRIFADGSVYPSPELTEQFKLEYDSKVTQDESTFRFGFDVVDSQEWPPMANQPRMILFGLTPKTESKVDLFATCRYDEQGNPRASVLTQGTVSTTLLDLVRQMGYLSQDQKYCDLQLLTEYPINVKDGISNIPKIVERGEKKGEKTYVRRENVTYYPVNIPENLKKKEDAEETKTVTTPLVTQ